MVKEVSYVDLGLRINHDVLKRIIHKWYSGEYYKYNYNLGYRGEELYENILIDILSDTEGIEYDIEKEALDNFGLSPEQLDFYHEYPKSDVRSIGWEVLNFFTSIGGGPVEELILDDIPFILEFLNTPADKTLEAWEKWESYWKNLDYPARRKKVLNNSEK